MLLSGTALAASDPAGVDTTDMPPELKGRETIVVKGQRIEQKLSEVSGSITVITEEDLDRQVATELTDVFKNEPGVSVTGSAGRPQNILIRGMGGNRVLIIKDGVRVSDAGMASRRCYFLASSWTSENTTLPVWTLRSSGVTLLGSVTPARV